MTPVQTMESDLISKRTYVTRISPKLSSPRGGELSVQVAQQSPGAKLSPNRQYLPTTSKVEISPTGTKVFVPDETRPHSSPANHTPRRITSPQQVKFRSKIPQSSSHFRKLEFDEGGSFSPEFANSRAMVDKITEARTSEVGMH